MSVYDPLNLLYEDYGATLRLALTNGSKTWRAVAIECEDAFDGEWNRETRLLPTPLARLGSLRFTAAACYRFLAVVARQAAWPDEHEPQLTLATTPEGMVA